MKKSLLLAALLLCIIHSASSHDLPTKKLPDTVSAGSSANGITVAGGYGKGSGANQLDNPQGIVVDDNGNIYIVDTYNNRIQKWAPGASYGVTVAGGHGQGAAANQLYNPSKIFIDAIGNIYIADQYNNRIQKWAPGASVGITVAGGNGRGAASNQLATPYDVFVDKIGDIFISDMNNNRIQRWSPGADTGVTVAGGRGRGSKLYKFDKPKGLFIDDSYQNLRGMYIVDANNARVQLWYLDNYQADTEAGGNGQGSDDNQLFDPESICFDIMYQMYITDPFNNRVQKWNTTLHKGVTVAGGNGAGATPDKLSSPRCVYVDKMGNIYVSDGNNNRVQKFEMPDNGAYLPWGITVAGGNSHTPYHTAADELSNPKGVAVDTKGNIFIGDYGNARIEKWAPGADTGIMIAGLLPGEIIRDFTQIPYALSVSVDTVGDIFITNTSQIQKYAPGSSISTIVAGGRYSGHGPGEFSYPRDLAIDWKGNMFIADFFNYRVQKWTPGASSGVTVYDGKKEDPNRHYGPTAVCVDVAGNLYVADNYERIQKWTPGATSGITVAGGNGGGDAANQFHSITGICIDADGALYVSDNGNHRIQKWLPGASQGITVAGGYSDYVGRGSKANQLSYPEKIFVDKQKNIYVADAGNNRIQKFVQRDHTICPKDVYIPFSSNSCSSKVTVKWPEPDEKFPATLYIPTRLDPRAGTLSFMGALNGHGYYKSSRGYSWPVSSVIAGTIADTSVTGHMATITSAVENDFIFNLIKSDTTAPWIGLFNIGFPGYFHWVSNEPTGYTNWIPGEPNNAGGGLFNIKEPYVRMSNLNGKWNDQRDDDLQFVAELDAPVLKYRQISGPPNGSIQKIQNDAVYQVCYEKTNLITRKKDTCCFNVIIYCDRKIVADSRTLSDAVISTDDGLIKGLHVTIGPNPSNSYFKLQISGGNSVSSANIKVTDIAGRQVEAMNNINANQTVEIGRSLKAGIYFVQVMQGDARVVEKIIKQ